MQLNLFCFAKMFRLAGYSNSLDVEWVVAIACSAGESNDLRQSEFGGWIGEELSRGLSHRGSRCIVEEDLQTR